ncbi:hypothetical protein BV898_07516 [Hypsibius exemplaris]|uniref:Uncharacterized protein n=1 Tax=Hypsibius exemplaris TaxID=2072580 RepID=A0A1W0WTM7_HYPEX|nr:hypothetical protein BV898_07516 [Hypsibius exemplaris]
MTTPTTTHKLVAHHHRTTILPKRIHHVTQHISSHTTHRPHRATHHPRRTTTSSTTKDPVTKTVHHVKLDPDEKYLEEKEVASLISKNELETVKQRGGHRDDETDRVQNDGSTNPDSQSSVKKLSQSSAASSLRVGFQTTRISCSSVLIQIAVFLSCCLLRVL